MHDVPDDKKIVLAIVVGVLPITFAHSEQAVDDLEEFQEAYAAHTECVHSGDVDCTLINAQLAFNHGSAVFKLEGKNIAALTYNLATSLTAVEDYYPLYTKSPKYPRSAIDGRRKGYVIVEYSVDEFGFTQDVTLVEWEGAKSVFEPSIEAAKKFLYAQRFEDGKPVKTEGVRNKFTDKMSS